MEKRRVLAVYPDGYLGGFLPSMLTGAGFSVKRAFSVKQGASLAAEEQFDLVLVDAFDQPEMSDFEATFLDELREADPNVPIVLCSMHPALSSLSAGEHDLAAIIILQRRLQDLVDTVRICSELSKGTALLRSKRTKGTR